MFVEPRPGSDLDKVAPAYLVRRLLGWVGKRGGGRAQPPVQQQSTATPANEPDLAGPDHLR
jgi:anaerobic selenocysteine-containing dehydrogenase